MILCQHAPFTNIRDQQSQLLRANSRWRLSFTTSSAMAPRSAARRPGRQRRRPGSLARDESGHFLPGNVPRSSQSLKPREERPYQEFHPDLDVTAKLLVITSTESSQSERISVNTPPPSVIPQKRKADRPLTPVRTSSRHSVGKNGAMSLANGQDGLHPNGINGDHATPNGVFGDGTADSPDQAQDVNSLVVPLDDRSPLQILRNHFAASLPMSRAETTVTVTQEPEYEVIAPFKNTPYIGRSMADVGYQESEYWSRPPDSYIRYYGTCLLEVSNNRNHREASGKQGRV